MTAEQAAAIAAHNLICAKCGDRSYKLAVNVPARTKEAQKVRQGSSVRAIAVGWG